MEMIEFAVANGLFPLYLGVTPGEGKLLRRLLGEGFRHPLQAGEPLDELFFDIFSSADMHPGVFFAAPAGVCLLGTFELRDAASAGRPAADRRPPRPTSH